MKLELPELKHKNIYEQLRKEWAIFEDISHISPWALFYWDNFDEFLRETVLYRTNSPTWVNSTLFLLVEDNDIIWAIDIRHNINNPVLMEKWGHIWYWVVPKFRKKWYATKMLELWLIEAKKMGIEKVLLTCTTENIPSNKVIKSNWGISDRLTNDWKMNRYWISL